MSKQLYFHQFDSPEAFDDFLSTAKPVWKAYDSDVQRTGFKNWYASPDLKAAHDLYRFGWPEGRKLINEVTADMQGGTNVEVLEVEAKIKDVAGDTPDVVAAISGDPENMWSTSSVETSTKILRVVVAADVSCIVKTETIMLRGGAVLSYIDALELAGWRCEVVWQAAVEYGDIKYSTEVVIKRAQDHLDIDRLAFSIANPAMFRRLFFRCIETLPETKAFYPSYGYPCSERPEGCDLYFPTLSRCDGVASALEYGQAVIDEQLIATS